MRDKTGKSKFVQDYVLSSGETGRFLQALRSFIDYVIPQFVSEGKSYLTIAIGCTGGKHRSVVISDEIRKHLKDRQYRTRIYHRDMYK